MANWEDMLERVNRAEDLLTQCHPPWRIESKLACEFKVSTRQARTYIKEARDRWAKEADEVDREGKRNAMRASVSMIFEKATNRQMVVRDSKGNPVGNGDTMMDAPELATAARAAQILIQLDGLAEPERKDMTLRLGDMTDEDLLEKAATIIRKIRDVDSADGG